MINILLVLGQGVSDTTGYRLEEEPQVKNGKKLTYFCCTESESLLGTQVMESVLENNMDTHIEGFSAASLNHLPLQRCQRPWRESGITDKNGGETRNWSYESVSPSVPRNRVWAWSHHSITREGCWHTLFAERKPNFTWSPRACRATHRTMSSVLLVF